MASEGSFRWRRLAKESPITSFCFFFTNGPIGESVSCTTLLRQGYCKIVYGNNQHTSVHRYSNYRPESAFLFQPNCLPCLVYHRAVSFVWINYSITYMPTYLDLDRLLKSHVSAVSAPSVLQTISPKHPGELCCHACQCHLQTLLPSHALFMILRSIAMCLR